MISYNRRRDLEASTYHGVVHNRLRQLGWTFVRQATITEDYANHDYYWRLPNGCVVSVQYKVQGLKSTWRSWNVQVGQWNMPVDYYVFHHVHTDTTVLIEAPLLKVQPKYLYDGHNTNQPFYYNHLRHIEGLDGVVRWVGDQQEAVAHDPDWRGEW